MIKIVTDSTCDLPKNLINELNISVIPLNLILDGITYADEIDISRQEFYERMPFCRIHPTTSTPSIGQVDKVFHQLADQGATEIIAIHLSESLSATINTIRAAGKTFNRIPVKIFDSGQLSIGTGFQVQIAAKMAKDGAPSADIYSAIRLARQNSFVAAALDSMEYLRRSGRINKIVNGIGSMIKLKPILTMRDGIARSELGRTRSGAEDKLINLLNNHLPVRELCVLHTNARNEVIQDFKDRIQNLTGLFDIPVYNITPVIGNHIGPNAIGFGCLNQ